MKIDPYIHCAARTHTLSNTSPLCPHCGFILCSLQSPVAPCPGCSSPLLSPTAREILIAKLESHKANLLAKEAAQREAERIRQEEADIAAAGGGAFPKLAGASTPGDRLGASAGGGGKVLSLNSKTKKVTITPLIAPSHTPPKRQASAEIIKPDVPKPVPAPPDEVERLSANALDPNRRWLDVRGVSLAYVPVKVIQATQGGTAVGGKRRRKKARRKEGEAQAEGEPSRI
jgi:hypothetical protein